MWHARDWGDEATLPACGGLAAGPLSPRPRLPPLP